MVLTMTRLEEAQAKLDQALTRLDRAIVRRSERETLTRGELEQALAQLKTDHSRLSEAAQVEAGAAAIGHGADGALILPLHKLGELIERRFDAHRPLSDPPSRMTGG